MTFADIVACAVSHGVFYVVKLDCVTHIRLVLTSSNVVDNGGYELMSLCDVKFIAYNIEYKNGKIHKLQIVIELHDHISRNLEIKLGTNESIIEVKEKSVQPDKVEIITSYKISRIGNNETESRVIRENEIINYMFLVRAS